MEKSGAVVGYAAVALELVSGKAQATVLELCCKNEEGEALVSSLIGWITEYAMANTVDAISFDAPSDDDLLRRIVKKHGFAEFPHTIPLLMVNDFAGLLQKITSLSLKRKTTDCQCCMLINLHYMDTK